LLFLGASQLGLDAVIGRWRPDWSEPEFGRRIVLLRRRLAEAPGRPLVVMLGSSRTGCGFLPQALADGEQHRAQPLVYNLSHTGSGPFLELLCLRRLLAQGIRPQAVAIEVLPPTLGWEGGNIQSPGYLDDRWVCWSDLTPSRRYTPAVAAHRYRQWLECSCSPWYCNRQSLMARYAPGWMTDSQVRDATFWRRAIGPLGAVPYVECVAPQDYERGLQVARKQYAWSVRFPAVDATADRALREMLALCRREGIHVAALVAMPEGSEFRSWYSPETRAVINAYLGDLCREYGTRFVDASAWMPDDCFQDGHHLLRPAACRFTQRLWQTALEPCLASLGVATPGLAGAVD
jgi:hypothetical protein